MNENEHQDNPTSQPPRPPSGWSRIDGTLHGFRSGLVNILFVTFVLFLIAIVLIDFSKGLKRNAILIEPIASSEKYTKKGYSSDVLSAQLVEHIQKIYRNAYSRERGNELYPTSGQPDVQLPGTGMSIHNISRYIHHIFGLTQPK